MKHASTKRTSFPPFKSCEKAELKHAKQYYSVKQQNIQCAPARKGEAMNVRKPVDYGTMYLELTAILAQIFLRWAKSMLSVRLSASARRKALRSQPQNFCRRIFLTAQAFPRAICAGCAIFTRFMKMTKRSSVWR